MLSIILLAYWGKNYLEMLESNLSITINTESITLTEDDEFDVFVIFNNITSSRINVTEHSQFSTSDPNVATVDSQGIIKAIGSGYTVIKIRYKEYVKELNVSVSNEYYSQVNVLDFGAIGDGRTDSTKAFQAAIDYLADRGGGEVLVPSGEFILEPIFLKPNVNLIGEQRDSVILKLSSKAEDGYNRLISMENNTKVQSITCDGNYQNHPNGTEHMHCIFVYDATNVVIKNSRVQNAIGDGISISGTERGSNFVVVKNNIIEENQRAQIVVEQVNHLKLTNNIMNSESGRATVHFEPWEEIQYYDAVISENKLTTNTNGYCVILAGSDSEFANDWEKGYFYNGIEFFENQVNCPNGTFLIEDTSDVNVYENKLTISELHVWRKNEIVSIFNNDIVAKNGILIDGKEDGKLVSTGTKIYGNTIRSRNEGISILSGADDSHINNNIFIGQGNFAGIKLFSSAGISNTRVEKNSFKWFDYGILIDYYQENTKISKIVISNNVFQGIKEFALYLQGPVHEITFEKNIVTNSSGVYIYIQNQSMSKVAIKDNKIFGGERGIVQSKYGEGNLNGLSIINNHISGIKNSYNAPIELEKDTDSPPKNVIISENILTRNGKNLIIVPELLKGSLSKNIFE